MRPATGRWRRSTPKSEIRWRARIYWCSSRNEGSHAGQIISLQSRARRRILFPYWEQMNVLNRELLVKAGREHANVRKQIEAWHAEVEQADWDGPDEIKRRYASASFLAGNVVIFNLRGNKYRLVVKVNYPGKIVLVKWFGTHAEYSKINF